MSKPAIAYFTSPHGFGHAARSAAVIEELKKRRSDITVHVITKVPKWFFTDSLSDPFEYHEVVTDIGFVQNSPLQENFDETIAALDQFLPFREELLQELDRIVRSNGCSLIVCDVAPIGISVGERLGIPSVLVENFTWDWIYSAYLEHDERFRDHIDYLAKYFRACTHLIQSEPVSVRQANADTVPPASRAPRRNRSEVRSALGLADDLPVVMLTMGGMRQRYDFLNKLKDEQELHFLVAGASENELQRDANLTLLPYHSDLYHPDLVHAVDAVVCKLGYSTVAEVYAAGTRVAYVPRRIFPESKILERFVKTELPSMEISEEELEGCGWTARLRELLNKPMRITERNNGSSLIAERIIELV